MITARTESITPQMAEQMLSANIQNRTVKAASVSTIARDMAAGQWQDNGETIKFDVNGRLVDGQHRLMAIVESGVTIRLLVVRGVSVGTQSTIDTGTKRGLADVLKINGEKNAADLATCLRGITLWEQGRCFTRKFTAQKASHSEMLTALQNNPGVRDLVPRIKMLQNKLGVPQSVGAALTMEFNRLDSDDSEFFFDTLLSGRGVDDGDSILALRELLIRRKMASAGSSKNHTDAYTVMALICKAWNKYRSGEFVKTLTFRPGGANPEAFPVPE